MIKFLAIYKVPENVEAFESHYQEVHMPIVRKIPGLKEVRVNKVFGTPFGKSELHMIAELCFENRDAFNNAMKSPEMMEAGKDAQNFAKGIMSLHFADESVESI